ncbi:MAG: hypothetical protein Ta2D_04220 [Rickettsiales bacterium]|nr:MAG: hypothetical protein Ta2D_04220 [Rickettsiales bacterium]
MNVALAAHNKEITIIDENSIGQINPNTIKSFRTKDKKEEKITKNTIEPVKFKLDASEKNIKKSDITYEKIDNELAEKILNKVKENLNTTGLFNNIDSDTNIIFSIKNNIKKFSKKELNSLLKLGYKNKKTGAVLTGYVIANKLYIKLWDNLDNKESFSGEWILDEYSVRVIANVISNQILTKLIGEKVGHFNTRLLFVSEVEGKKKITIMNYDGSNLKYLTDGEGIVFTPIFSKHNNEEIIFLEYFEGVPKLYKMNITTGIKEKIKDIRDMKTEVNIELPELNIEDILEKKDEGEKQNLMLRMEKMNQLTQNIKTNKQEEEDREREEEEKIDDEMTFAPSFNPMKNEIICSKQQQSKINIYKINLDTNKIIQLTNEIDAINTTPSYSPDGTKIVFVSNISEKKKLYVMNADGSDLKMISQTWGSYDRPVWSPDGKLIAFIKQRSGNFYVGLITANGENERLIVNDYLIEGIKWSPNSRYIMYAKQRSEKDNNSLYTLDIITGMEYKIPTPKDVSVFDPDWN